MNSSRKSARRKPNATAISRRPSRTALPTMLKPEAQMKPVFSPSA